MTPLPHRQPRAFSRGAAEERVGVCWRSSPCPAARDSPSSAAPVSAAPSFIYIHSPPHSNAPRLIRPRALVCERARAGVPEARGVQAGAAGGVTGGDESRAPEGDPSPAEAAERKTGG